MQFLKQNDTILFQGDSITDCGRLESDNGLGFGYAALIAAHLQSNFPQENYTILNRGISGNRVVDLQARWQEDCLDLKPDVLSILVGVNDAVHKFTKNIPTSAADYKAGYKDILTRAKAANPDLRIIMLEPFLLPVPEKRTDWREDLNEKITAVRELASEFGALYVPLDGIFAAKSALRAPAFWSADGIHPTLEGAGVIENAWLETAGMK